MGSLKTLALAGVVATVATSAAFLSPARAADLLPPPMMAPPAPYVESMGGLYLRGDVGVSSYSEAKASSRFAPGYVVPDARFDRTSFGNPAFVAVGVGYQFNNFLRFDATAEFRTSSQYSAVQSYSNTSGLFPPVGVCGARCYDNYAASLRSNVFLANAYVDMGTWRGVTPFIGAGVGAASHKISNLTDTDVQAPGYGIASDRTKSTFAWALMAGLGFEVTRNLKMEVGYRYLNMGNLESNPIRCSTAGVCANEVQKYKLDSHDVKIGFRYMLSDDLPAAPMAAPVYAAPAAPMIRKY